MKARLAFNELNRQYVKIQLSRKLGPSCRGGSKTAATSKMEHFVVIVNGFQLLTIITTCSILDVAVDPDPPPASCLFLKKSAVTLIYNIKVSIKLASCDCLKRCILIFFCISYLRSYKNCL